MTTIGMHYDVLPGKEAEFKHGFAGVVTALKGMAGHVESQLFEAVAQPGTFLILSRWKTLEDFQAFIKSEAFARVTAWGRAEILRGRPRHQVYQDG
jgi:heme-degrading monooxygenase HmoA